MSEKEKTRVVNSHLVDCPRCGDKKAIVIVFDDGTIKMICPYCGYLKYE